MPQVYKGWTAEKLVEFEDEIKTHFLNGEIRAPIHLSGGNEQQLINIFARDDIGNSKYWCFSNHRSHYHALLKGIEPQWIKKEILSGRSMSLNNKEHNFFTSSIVGGCPPIALGVAMGIKRRRIKSHVWVFVGDMAAESGMFHECTKYAARNDLPITFVIEDNGLSTNTPTQIAWGSYSCKPDVVKYKYKRQFPHINVGRFVTFR